jgi:predicted transcriptional regulator
MATAVSNQSRFSVTVSMQDGAIKKITSGAITAPDAEEFADELVSVALAIRGLAREIVGKQASTS